MGELSSAVADLERPTASTSISASAAAHGQSSGQQAARSATYATSHGPSTGPLMVVPASIFGDIVGGLAGTVSEQLGGEWFRDKALGKAVGSAAGRLISHLSPFEILPPQVVAANVGPDNHGAGTGETLVVVPAGFLTGLLGGVGGKLLGGAVSSLFGKKKIGEDIGSAAGGALGSIFGPFQVVPPQVAPQSAGPGDRPPDADAMVVVPAGWLGDLFQGISSSVATTIGGDTGRTVAQVGEGIGKLVPWQALPPELSPASAGPDGTDSSEEMVVVPAGWLSNIASTFAGTIGSGMGGLLGNAQLGKQVGDAAAPLIKLIPFSTVPEELQPQSAGPGGTPPQDKLVFVPAGLFGGLLGSFGGVLGSCVGDVFGQAKAGAEVGDAVSKLGQFLPFQVLPDGSAA